MAGLGVREASGRVESGSLVVRMGPLLSFEPHTDIRQPDEDLSFLYSKKIPQEMQSPDPSLPDSPFSGRCCFLYMFVDIGTTDCSVSLTPLRDE